MTAQVIDFGAARARPSPRLVARQAARQESRERRDRAELELRQRYERELATWPKPFRAACEGLLERPLRVARERDAASLSRVLDAIVNLRFNAAHLREVQRLRFEGDVNYRRPLVRAYGRELLVQLWLLGVRRLDRATLGEEASSRCRRLQAAATEREAELAQKIEAVRGRLARGTSTGKPYKDRTRLQLEAEIERLGVELRDVRTDQRILAGSDQSSRALLQRAAAEARRAHRGYRR